MVPISFIAKALGANVSWDNNTKTVSVQTKQTKTEKETEIWNQKLSDNELRSYMNARNAAISFMTKHDTRDKTGRELVSNDYDSDVPAYSRDVIIPNGGVYPSYIDYEVVDAKNTEGIWVIRVKIYEWLGGVSEDQKIQIMYIDFHVDAKYLIKGVWLASKPQFVDQHTVFPGLTVKKE
jgi:hypothetical protein